MDKRFAPYILRGLIEFDEKYFNVVSSEIKQEKLIRGRGAVGKCMQKLCQGSTFFRRY